MSDSEEWPRSLSATAFWGLLRLGSLQAIATSLSLGTFAYLNRAMEAAPEQMALWSVIIRVVLALTLVTELGLSVALLTGRLVPGVATTIARIQLMVGTRIAASLFALAAPLASLFPDLDQAELTSLLRLIAPLFLFISLGLPSRALLQRRLEFRTVASVECFVVFAQIAFMLWLGPKLGVRGLAMAALGRHAFETRG